MIEKPFYVPCGPCGGAGQHLVAVVEQLQNGKLVSRGQQMVTCSWCHGAGDVSPQACRVRRMQASNTPRR